MADELLRTKLMPPPGHVDLIPRDRLHQLLDGGVRAPLTLVVAPAGAGKTSLVRSWRATETGRTMALAWVALDEDDNDPVRFWRYAIAALETLVPELTEPARSHLNAAPSPPLDAVLIALINSLAALEQPCVLTFDDYHVIDTPRIHDTLTFLIERLPPYLRLVLVTRADPPLPLARWRARGQLVEIRHANLRFTEGEAAQLLDAMLERSLTTAQVASLTRRTEGWAAGLHLAALALRGREDAETFLDTFTGSHQFVMTYLVEDVLARQPDSVQRFLLETSILGQLCGPLCDAVTERNDGSALLSYLAGANLFTTPLDDVGYWYRYHQLFAGVLEHRLRQTAPDRVSELHRRAAAWYESQGLLVQAIDHAIKARDDDFATRLITIAAESLLSRGEALLVKRWLDNLPAAIIRGHVRLCLTGAWSQLISGPLDAVEPWLQDAERAAASDAPSDLAAVRGEIAALRTVVASFGGDIQRTISEAGEARRHLPAANVNLRGVVAMSLGQAYRFEGALEAAGQAYREAVALSREVGNLYVAVDSLSDLGIVLMQQGRLREADRAYRQAEQLIAEKQAQHSPVAGALAVIWPELLRERNQLEAALDMAQWGIELGHQGSKMDILITGYRSLAKIKWALHAWAAAIAAITQSWEFAQHYGVHHTARAIEALRAQMSLARGDLRAAEEWADRFRPDPNLPGTVQESEALTLARIRLASGQPDQALRLTGQLFDEAELAGRMWSRIAILAVQSLAHQARGNTEAALTDLGRALERASQEGFVRVFLDEGEPMAALLRRAVAYGIEAGYAGTLLAAFGGPTAHVAATPSAASALIEPLSEREQSVLRLLATGMSGPEIADELFVSASTVRTHLKGIYRKLDVHSRDQAIFRAKELNLI